MKKIVILGFLLVCVSSLLIWYWKQQQFVVLVNKSSTLSAKLNLNVLDSFIKTNLPPGSKISIGTREGKSVGSENLEQVKIILTDETQATFALRYKALEKPATSSGLEIVENTLEIYIQIDPGEVDQGTNGAWLLSTNIAQSIFYIRENSKELSIDQRRDLSEYYQTHLWTSEVYTSIEKLGLFGKVEKK